MAEKALGPNHRTVGTHLSNLAGLYKDQGRFGEAEPLFKSALAIAEKALGPDHPDVGGDINSLAELYRDQGRFTEAEPLYKRTLAIAEKALGPAPPTVGKTRTTLAILHHAQGRFADAEPLYSARSRSMRRRSALTTPMSPETSTTSHGYTSNRATGRALRITGGEVRESSFPARSAARWSAKP